MDARKHNLPHDIKKILIVNRGEVAMRIIRACKQRSLQTIAVYREGEEEEMHLRHADETYSLGKGDISSTWLNISKIIEIANISECDAVHPGYGFLSENADFARACEQNGLIFIGPPPAAIEAMGNKLNAISIAHNAGVPVLLYEKGHPDELIDRAALLNYPVMIKAVSGGGGRGIRVVQKKEHFEDALKRAGAEAEMYFGDDQVFVEPYLPNARHIEVQILGDKYGNIIHLYERECSIQRKRQKIIEEAPSPGLPEQVRQDITKSALSIANTVGYQNAGTVEFLVAPDNSFYFLEMNTRIQVEHGVTELVTGIDLVNEQINIAEGKVLRYKQKNVVLNGHAIEVRICAENPEHDFIPSAGKIEEMNLPLDSVRIDQGYQQGDRMFPDYDSLICKMIQHALSRQDAIQQLLKNLKNTFIYGVHTNVRLLAAILNAPPFINNDLNVNYLESEFCTLNKTEPVLYNDRMEVAVIFLSYFMRKGFSRQKLNGVWNSMGYWRIHNFIRVFVDGEEFKIDKYRFEKNKGMYVRCNGKDFYLSDLYGDHGKCRAVMNNHKIEIFTHQNEFNQFIVQNKGYRYKVQLNRYENPSSINAKRKDRMDGEQIVMSPLHGKIYKIHASETLQVKKGDVLMVIEAMKMENRILAPEDGKLEHILVKEGQQVSEDTPLVKLRFTA